MKIQVVPMLALGASCLFHSLPGRAAEGRSGQQELNPAYQLKGDSRKFSIEYIGLVTNIPNDTAILRVWLPVPQNSGVQTIGQLKLVPNARITTEDKYGNRMAYWEIPRPGNAHEFQMTFTCTRREAVMNLEALKADGHDSSPVAGVFTHPDRLVLVDDHITQLAKEITAGKTSTLEKARAIYFYVLNNMVYDKNHPGWGSGSTQHACDVGKGNCTDFHALFNSLCRAEGIPSGFEIGLYLPYVRGKAEPVGGYHCWAFFHVPGKSWVPVDCSEGDRVADRRDYFFGNHTPNRVTLSTGRDLVLFPPQKGAALNYFLNPYAEADGVTVKTDKAWSYRDLD